MAQPPALTMGFGVASGATPPVLMRGGSQHWLTALNTPVTPPIYVWPYLLP